MVSKPNIGWCARWALKRDGLWDPMLVGERNDKWWFVLLPNQCGTIHPLRGPASSLALFPSSNRCGTTPKSTHFGAQHPYWHIVSCLPLSGNSEKAGTSSVRGRFPHPCKCGLFSSPTNGWHHNPSPFGAQRPCSNSFLPPIDMGPPQIHPL